MAHRPVIKIALVGFGTAAHAFLALLYEKRNLLPFTAAISGVIFKDHGFHGLHGKALLLEKFIETPPPMHSITGGVSRFIKKINADVLLELTPLNIQNGEPAAGYLRAAINRGIHIISSNKGPIAFHFDTLNQLALQNKLCFLFGATIGKGLPVFTLKRYASPTAQFSSIRAQLNSTTNYVLTRMQEGVPEMQAVAEAQAAGMCEYSPHLDLDGWDGAIQSAILANVLMQKLEVEAVFRDKFQSRAGEIIKRTQRSANKVRQIVHIENANNEVKASVRLQVISEGDPFFHLQASDYAITLESDTMGELTLTTKSPTKQNTASALLADLCDIYYRGIKQQKDPELFDLDFDSPAMEPAADK
ncbi:MAG: hypothetical protein DWQ05_04095 [Calditrichaeota bacterium]|nr:MAG: hypothetical protein DWQ05_04095 [Calditrichota bacterium]